MARFRFRWAVFSLLLLALTSCTLGAGNATSSTPIRQTSTAGPPLTPAGSDLTYKVSGYSLHAWPAGVDITSRSLFNLGDLRDSTGAKLVERKGHSYDAPVTQAQDGMEALAVYQHDGNAAAMRVALADANRLVARHVVYAGAWWYPYPFDFTLYGLSIDVAKAPWYSAMAQGQVLELFTRLYAQTHDAQWRTDADNTFASFLHPYQGDNSVPWIDNIASGYLWLQEYPSPKPDYTINGAFFATFGVAEYAIAFGNQQAARIADGAFTTMLHFIGQAEDPGWISYYSLTHKWDQSQKYHGIVTHELALSYAMTQDIQFATWATRFSHDYPLIAVSGPITLAPGSYTLARTQGVDAIGNPAPALGKRTQITLTSATTISVDTRWAMRNSSGFWYHISAGPYKNSWIQESTSVYVSLPVNVLAYYPAAPFTLSAGTYHLYIYQHGQPLQSAGTLTLNATSEMALSEHATIYGVDLWQVGTGPNAGKYLSGATPQIKS